MKCSCEWCDNTDIYSKKLCLCHKHYQQMKRHGKLFKTIYDPNDIICHETYSEIIIRNKSGEEISRSKIDNEYVDIVSEYKWCLQSQGYVLCRELNMYLHEFIMGKCPDHRIDHINRDPLDNRKHNLRYATAQENSRNRSIQKNNKSGYVGVHLVKSVNKWQATIVVDGKSIYLGLYEDINEAIRVRKEAEEKYFGDFSPK